MTPLSLLLIFITNYSIGVLLVYNLNVQNVRWITLRIIIDDELHPFEKRLLQFTFKRHELEFYNLPPNVYDKLPNNYLRYSYGKTILLWEIAKRQHIPFDIVIGNITGILLGVDTRISFLPDHKFKEGDVRYHSLGNETMRDIIYNYILLPSMFYSVLVGKTKYGNIVFGFRTLYGKIVNKKRKDIDDQTEKPLIYHFFVPDINDKNIVMLEDTNPSLYRKIIRYRKDIGVLSSAELASILPVATALQDVVNLTNIKLKGQVSYAKQ
jgi:hypothetical protein